MVRSASLLAALSSCTNSLESRYDINTTPTRWLNHILYVCTYLLSSECLPYHNASLCLSQITLIASLAVKLSNTRMSATVVAGSTCPKGATAVLLYCSQHARQPHAAVSGMPSNGIQTAALFDVFSTVLQYSCFHIILSTRQIASLSNMYTRILYGVC